MRALETDCLGLASEDWGDTRSMSLRGEEVEGQEAGLARALLRFLARRDQAQLPAFAGPKSPKHTVRYRTPAARKRVVLVLVHPRKISSKKVAFGAALDFGSRPPARAIENSVPARPRTIGGPLCPEQRRWLSAGRRDNFPGFWFSVAGDLACFPVEGVGV